MFSQTSSFKALLVCLFCILVPNAKSDYSILTEQSDKVKVTTELVPKVNCGESQKIVDMCFEDLPPQLMEFLTTTKIAANKVDITSKCTVFKQGMKCFDSYTDRCISKEKNYHLQNNVAGARKFFSKFCDDKMFQSEYNRHKECFIHIQDDWKRCTIEFQNILSDELHVHNYPRNITNKFMQFCCARHAYETCIYNSARFKCYKKSAKFAKNTAKMLSEEKLFSNCRRYEILLCAAPGIPTRQPLIVLFISSAMIMAWRCEISFRIM